MAREPYKLDGDTEDYESVIDIDELSLDKEWINQPKLYMRYAIQLAEARQAYAESKAAFDLVRAELELEIRNSPQDFDLGKVTENTVESCVITQEAYKKAQREMNQAKHDLDVIDAVVTALEHRKKALEGLVYLHGQNYFSTPKVPTKAADTIREKVKSHTRKKGKPRDDDD